MYILDYSNITHVPILELNISLELAKNDADDDDDWEIPILEATVNQMHLGFQSYQALEFPAIITYLLCQL